jgi:hypothetical protein
MREEADGIIRIETDGVDVEEVMRHIDERVASRGSAPEYKEESVEELEQRGMEVDRGELFADPLQELSMSIQFARGYAEIHSNFPLGSSRKVIGPLIVFAKKVVRKFLQTYMDAVFDQQREFNRRLLNIIENLDQLILRDRARKYPGGIDRASFYERWGDDFDQTAARLRPLAGLFRGAEWVVDLNAGRGEFLRAASDEEVEVVGVEADVTLAGDCQQRGLPVLCIDPLVYLEQAPDASVPAVFTRGLGERMLPHELRYAINLLADRMPKGAALAILNHRPTSFYGGEKAFRDPTIERLVHPEALVFLLEKAGFAQAESRPFLKEGQVEEEKTGEKAGEKAGEKPSKESEAVRKALDKMEKDNPGIGEAWREFTAPAQYLVLARR